MKKDKKWFINKWTKELNKTDFYDPMHDFINEFISDVDQFDEPETLSQEWIGEHAKAVAYDGMPDQTEVVYVDDLRNLLVPKQEKVKIKQGTAKSMERYKEQGYTLKNFLVHADSEEHEKTIARAWLDGYEVEEEQKYYVVDNSNRNLLYRHKHNVITELEASLLPATELVGSVLTEQEIKDYDERYWAFRKPVEELEDNID